MYYKNDLSQYSDFKRQKQVVRYLLLFYHMMNFYNKKLVVYLSKTLCLDD